jgi:anti-sigma factor RsiW
MPDAGLTCREFVEIVTAYLEGTMPPGERARFETHLAGCRHCATYFDQMRLTIRALGRLTENTLPPDVKDDLFQMFRGWKRR